MAFCNELMTRFFFQGQLGSAILGVYGMRKSKDRVMDELFSWPTINDMAMQYVVIGTSGAKILEKGR